MTFCGTLAWLKKPFLHTLFFQSWRLGIQYLFIPSREEATCWQICALSPSPLSLFSLFTVPTNLLGDNTTENLFWVWSHIDIKWNQLSIYWWSMRQGFWKFGFLVIINVIFVFWFMVSLRSAVICSYQMLWSPWQLPTRFFYYFPCQSVRDTVLRHNPAKGWAIFTSFLHSEREHSEHLSRAAQPLMMEVILYYFVFGKTLSQVQPGWDTSIIYAHAAMLQQPQMLQSAQH